MTTDFLLSALRTGLYSACLVISCSLLFGLRGRPVVYNGGVGFVSMVVWALTDHLGSFASTVIASTVLSLLGQFGARILRTPASAFLIPCIYPLVPGTAIYYMTSAFLVGDGSGVGKYAMEALLISTAIAVGYVIAETCFSLFQLVMNKKQTAIKWENKEEMITK